MCDEPTLTPAQDVLASQLGQIRPSPEAINHDLFMFKVGRASARSHRTWQGLSGILTVLLICSLLGPFRGGRSPVIPTPAPVAQQRTAQDDAQANVDQDLQQGFETSYAYLSLREGVIKRGMDALPAQPDRRGRRMPRTPKEWVALIMDNG